MDLKELTEVQREFDRIHGWLPKSGSATSILQFLQEDIIGLCGEIGELAGVVKDLALEVRRDPEALSAELGRRMPDFKGELVDVFVYLLRMASYLDIDLEESYLDKLEKNRVRFKRYED